jgi:RNA polymerase sigma-70 factor, ECF subfamily
MSPAEREIAQLYQQLGPVVYRRAVKLLRNPADAADATQQIFLKLLKNTQRLREGANTVPWLLEVTNNHCFNVLRDSKRRAQQLENAGTVRSEAQGDLEQETADRQMAAQVLTKLEAQGAEVAARVLVAEQDHQVVAQQLGISEKTVQRKLKRFIESARKMVTRRS